MLLYLATEGSEEGPNPVVPPLGEIIIGAIGFAILALVLMRYVWPRMEATFEARRDAIEGGLKRAEDAQNEAQRLLGEYRQQLAEARTEAAQIRDNARAEGQRIIEEMRTTAQQESARIVARGEEQLSVQRQQVVRDLRGEIGTLATRLAERVVGEELSESGPRGRTVDRFLDELDGMAQSVPAGAPAGGAAASGGSGATGGDSDGGGIGATLADPDGDATTLGDDASGSLGGATAFDPGDDGGSGGRRRGRR
jgi:F-type H+-transporting ATPase subunit b